MISLKKRDDETITYNNGRGSYYGISHIFITKSKFLGLKANYIEGHIIKRYYFDDEKL